MWLTPVTGYLSLKDSSWITCHLFFCLGMHMTRGARAPSDAHPLVFGHIPGRSFPARTHGETRGLLSWSPRHHALGELAGAECGGAVVRCHFQRALCSSPFIALMESLCRASSSPPLVCSLRFNFHSLLKAGCQVSLPALGGPGSPHNPPCRFAKPQGSAQVNAGTGKQIQVRGISSQRHLLQQPQWEQAGGALKDKGVPSLGEQGGCCGHWVSCLPAGGWLGCAETAVFDLGLLHAAVEIVTGWGLVYCLE